MFTGLVEEVGAVESIRKAAVNKLEISCQTISSSVALGDSVAVNGVCLTVTSVKTGVIGFEFVQETLQRSTLADLSIGDPVNLETSLKAGKPLGGHFVLGHVDGVGTIRRIKTIGESREITVGAGPDVLRYVVEKGSIAVDGISLTIARFDDISFTIAVIPHTLSNTTLIGKKAGDNVNLEADILGKYVERLLPGNRSNNGVTMDLLRDSGFIS